ncbi:MAG: sporulation membrane protein YtaF [Desulfitobacteriaceae bacterium]
MHWISALLLGLAANLDNFGIGVSYGIQKVRIPFLSNFLIALLSGIVVVLSVVAGESLSQFIGWANWLGAFMIMGIGLWIANHKSVDKAIPVVSIPSVKTYSLPLRPLNSIIQVTKNPSAADLDANGFISAQEAIALGFTLALNCIATGFGAGLTGVSPFSLGISVFLFSMITISTGYLTGWKTTSDRFERGAQILSGVLLILIGIYELLN